MGSSAAPVVADGTRASGRGLPLIACCGWQATVAGSIAWSIAFDARAAYVLGGTVYDQATWSMTASLYWRLVAIAWALCIAGMALAVVVGRERRPVRLIASAASCAATAPLIGFAPQPVFSAPPLTEAARLVLCAALVVAVAVGAWMRGDARR